MDTGDNIRVGATNNPLSLRSSGIIQLTGSLYSAGYDISEIRNITASGNINSSGRITAIGFYDGSGALFTNPSFVGNVTASGDISASGDIFGSTLYTNGAPGLSYSSFADAYSLGGGGANPSLTFSGDFNLSTGALWVASHITASGDISASGDVQAVRFI